MALKGIPEPPDGTMVVLVEWDGERKVIWRLDENRDPEAMPDENWFDDESGYGMNWENVTKYADQAYLVFSEPMNAD